MAARAVDFQLPIRTFTLALYTCNDADVMQTRIHACVWPLLQSTYCNHLYEHCQAIRRTVHVVNLGECAAGMLNRNEVGAVVLCDTARQGVHACRLYARVPPDRET